MKAKLGGKVVCTRSDLPSLGDEKYFTQGKEYEIKGVEQVDEDRIGVILVTDDGETAPPVVLKGNYWDFEVIA